MKNKIVFFFLFFISSCFSQSTYYNMYEETMKSKTRDNNIDSIISFSKSGNVLKFMELGYFVNANTMMFNYEINDKIINNILKAGKSGQNSYKWRVTEVDFNNQNYIMKGKEFIIYEGYLFRYIAEYMYKNPNNQIYDKNIVKNTFFKWYDKSIKENGDSSLLYGIRVHMGTHWATIALYLMKLDPENYSLYKKFVDRFNLELKSNLKTVFKEGIACYIWNSSYNNRSFSKILKKRTQESVIQDVSHGNHIVQYVVDSFNFGDNFWKSNDLDKFTNTLKYIIWKNKIKPADNIDGSFYTSAHMGWKQSDGFMKLMNFKNDKELYSIYSSYYIQNKDKVDKFYPNLQFYANMYIFEKNNIK